MIAICDGIGFTTVIDPNDFDRASRQDYATA